MLLQDRMPNFEDTLIMFQAYPLGSSLFIYYVCKIVGTTEACFLWAQIILMLSALFSGLVFVTKKNRYAAGVWAIYAIYAFVKIAVLAHTARSTRAILPKQESHLAGWLNSGWLN